MITLFIIISLAFCLMVTSMIIALDSLSLNHLKLWAKKKDPVSAKLYPLKVLGSSTRLTLELVRSLFLSVSVVYISKGLHPVLAVLVNSFAVFVLFAFISRAYLKPFGIRLLSIMSAQIISTIKLLKPIVNPLGRLLDNSLGMEPVTLTRADILEYIDKLEPNDSDLSTEEISIFKHALNFGSKDVHSIMTPKKMMTSVKTGENLSPVLIDDLYKSGHSRFPVLSDDGKDVVGMLYMHDLVDLSAHGFVRDHMNKRVFFVHEDRELDHVLQAFLKTKQHLFIVVNSFAEIVGVVTIEDVFEQIIGKPIIDEFDRYDDLRSVAEEQAKKHRIQNKEKMVE